ncbi:iron-containing alcohol dehydrogenase family protein [Natronoglycomyces albus]|uniref:Iron-containing alcohol dehydrogenase family protein n=1 Tax=Natronoglycomyces albus TaxID=2811108 RepID=A0A895XNG4_9ACTN|nr:iron-containing alcohol dehydrogenase family protein [Natronoglycomyces albus]QSB05083.1 iron-containing alcohol dehydrogenase family protein [Natronoglycomyces albus]
MPLLARTILAPIAVEVSAGALQTLPDLLVDTRISSGGRVAIVLGPGLGKRLDEQLRTTFPDAVILHIVPGSIEAASMLSVKLRESDQVGRGVDALVGIGGGRLIDTAKYAATQLGLPMVAVATSLAHDGIASPTASLEREGHSVSYGVHIPLAVLVDLDLVRTAPIAQLRAGAGDALSNLSATADWQLAAAVKGEALDGLALSLARTGAEAVLRHPLGADALSGNPQHNPEDFLATLANGLIQGGLAMAIAGSSRPCSGGCHEIAHALETLHPGCALHGEQGALGALFCTYLRGDANLFSELADGLGRFGLPRLPSDIGLTSEQFTDVVLHAPMTRPGRYTILEHKSLERDTITGLLADIEGELA